MKILHVVGGNFKSGAFKGAYILHNALVKNKIDSKILNDTPNESISERRRKANPMADIFGMDETNPKDQRNR